MYKYEKPGRVSNVLKWDFPKSAILFIGFPFNPPEQGYPQKDAQRSVLRGEHGGQHQGLPVGPGVAASSPEERDREADSLGCGDRLGAV